MIRDSFDIQVNTRNNKQNIYFDTENLSLFLAELLRGRPQLSFLETLLKRETKIKVDLLDVS
jgi:hypothetical protein